MTAIPSDGNVINGSGHLGDHNSIADVLGLLAQSVALLNGANNSPPGGNASNISAISTGAGNSFPVVLNDVSTPSTPTAGPVLYGLSGAVGAVDTTGNINNLSRIVQTITTTTISSTTPQILPGTTAINVNAGSVYVLRGLIIWDCVTTAGNVDFSLNAGASSMTASSMRLIGQSMANTNKPSPGPLINSAFLPGIATGTPPSHLMETAPLAGTNEQAFWWHGTVTVGVAGTLQMNTNLHTGGTGSYSVKSAGSYLEYIQIT